MPFVGPLSRAAFVNLGEQYSRDTEMVIGSIKAGGNHLLNLITTDKIS